MKRVTLAVISIIVLGAAGCTGGPQPAPTPTSSAGEGSSGTAQQGQASGSGTGVLDLQRNATDLFGPLPLDAYMLTTAERHQLDTAIKTLTDRCMADFGFTPGEELPSLEELIIVDRESRNRRYGLVDVEQAKISGLLPAHVLWSNARSEKRTNDPARLLVEVGDAKGLPLEDQKESPGEVDGKAIPANGCLGQAREKVYGTNTANMHFTLADDLENIGTSETAADPRIVAAEQQWVSCMKERGYTFRDSQDDTERDKVIAGLKESERPSQAEVQLAVAEAECTNKVNYSATAYAVEVEYQKKIIEKNQLALTAEREEIDKALAKANELMKEN